MDPFDFQTLQLTRQLISAKSVSPRDAGCQILIAEQLEQMDFHIEHMPFEDVSNLWACHGNGPPCFVFAGHTDVVPAEPATEWQTPPFEPTTIDEHIHGRGAADMKGSLAAMLTATRRFLTNSSAHSGTLAFLITSDEEGEAINGTRKVMAELQSRHINLNWCLIGEPSSNDRLGDVIRTGRRGSLHAELTIKGIGGHVAYPDNALNPIHQAMPALVALTNEIWDTGNEFFPPTSMQISNIHAGTGILNVIPASLTLLINFRFSTETNQKELSERTEALLNSYRLDYQITWTLSGNPFLTTDGELIPAVQNAIKNHLDIDTKSSTSGGTSDGRFIAPTGTQVVELGPRNATIHKIDESVSIRDLISLGHIYEQILEQLLR